MESTNTAKIYIRLYKSVRIPPAEPVTIRRVARLNTDPGVRERIEDLILERPIGRKRARRNRSVIDLMTVISVIKAKVPEAEIENIGPTEVVVEHADSNRKTSVLYVAIVWLLLFTGSGLAIMNFHADVSMANVHQKMFLILTGSDDRHPLWLQIPYSIGLGSGMVVFFNRFFRRKLNDEPDPLELEMFQYEDSIRQYRTAEQLKPETDADKSS